MLSCFGARPQGNFLVREATRLDLDKDTFVVLDQAALRSGHKMLQESMAQIKAALVRRQRVEKGADGKDVFKEIEKPDHVGF